MKIVKKEISKKIVISIVIGVLIISGTTITILSLNNKNNDKKSEEKQEQNEEKEQQEQKEQLIILKNNLEFEINSEVNLLSLVDDENNNVEITSKDETIDTTTLGEKDITLKYLDNEEEKEYKFKINIIDTTAPTINFKSKLSTTTGTKIDLLENVKVSDNSKEKIKAKIEGNYDFDKAGTYTLKYVAIDSSNNKTEEEFVLSVNQKPTSTTKPSTSNNSSNNNNANTNNDSNTSEKDNQNSSTKPDTNNNNSNDTNTNTNNNSSTSEKDNQNSSTKPDTNNNNSTNNNANTNNNSSTTEKDNQNNSENSNNSNQNNPETTPKITQEYKQSEAKALLTLINNKRTKSGLKKLTWNTSLESSAKVRAKELVTSLSSTRPNKTSFETAITIKYISAAELFASGVSTAEQIIDNVDVSSKTYTDIGISLYYDSESKAKYYWVLLFAEVDSQTAEYRQTEANKMITLINQARKENGLSELKLNSSLENSAKIRSKELVTLYSHTRPNQTDALTAITISYKSAGENIAAGQKSVQEVFEAWMNSPGHRANILNENYTDIGISWYYDPNSTYKYHWVQLFASI